MINTREMACHTWALSGNPIAGKLINQAYTSLMDEIGLNYEYGENLKGKALAAIQQETMDKIRLLCEGRKRQLNDIVYLCGGFRNGQVCPEHLWLENHTTGRTHDTFINQEVRRVDRIGVDGQPFQPGCEAEAFSGNEIARVQVNGYTDGQFASLSDAILMQGCSCGCSGSTPNYVYAIGNIHPHFPSKGVEMEYKVASESLGKAVTEYFEILSQKKYTYLANRICWVMNIGNMESYIIKPRSNKQLQDIIDTLKPTVPDTPTDNFSIVVGVLRPTAAPSMCNGLQLPIVMCTQHFNFNYLEHVCKITELDIKDEVTSSALSTMESRANNGDDENERAINYLAFRSPEIYKKAVQMKHPDREPEGVHFLKEISTQSVASDNNSKVVEVIYTYQKCPTGEQVSWSCSVDVAGQFPFITSALSQYVPMD